MRTTFVSTGERRDANPYIPGGERLAGPNSATTGVSSWTEHAAVAWLSGPITLIYTLFDRLCRVYGAEHQKCGAPRDGGEDAGILTGAAAALT